MFGSAESAPWPPGSATLAGGAVGWQLYVQNQFKYVLTGTLSILYMYLGPVQELVTALLVPALHESHIGIFPCFGRLSGWGSKLASAESALSSTKPQSRGSNGNGTPGPGMGLRADLSMHGFGVLLSRRL